MSEGLNENVVYHAMRQLAGLIAKFWRDNVYPVRFDEVFYLPGVRVHMVVEEHKRPDDTKPIGERKA